jgi:hypothetical protein
MPQPSQHLSPPRRCSRRSGATTSSRSALAKRSTSAAVPAAEVGRGRDAGTGARSGFGAGEPVLRLGRAGYHCRPGSAREVGGAPHGEGCERRGPRRWCDQLLRRPTGHRPHRARDARDPSVPAAGPAGGAPVPRADVSRLPGDLPRVVSGARLSHGPLPANHLGTAPGAGRGRPEDDGDIRDRMEQVGPGSAAVPRLRRRSSADRLGARGGLADSRPDTLFGGSGRPDPRDPEVRHA